MKNAVITLLTVAACALSSGAMAQVYVSGAAGAGKVNLDCSGFDTCDHSSLAFRVIAGYTFMPGLSAELGYMQFGKSTATLAASSDVPEIRFSYKPEALTLGVAYRMPVSENWSLTGRLGAANMRTKVSIAAIGNGSVSDSSTETTVYYGIGTDYALSKDTQLELGLDFARARYQNKDANADVKADVQALTFGIRHSF